jgi:hypothetical protein
MAIGKNHKHLSLGNRAKFTLQHAGLKKIGSCNLLKTKVKKIWAGVDKFGNRNVLRQAVAWLARTVEVGAFLPCLKLPRWYETTHLVRRNLRNEEILPTFTPLGCSAGIAGSRSTEFERLIRSAIGSGPTASSEYRPAASQLWS